jgi:hypothetical protein
MGLWALGALLTLSACSGEEAVKVESLQKKDKNLSCAEVQLEINEAEFYKRTAEKKKQPGVTSLLMPLGYISTYMNAADAASAADARIDYLNRIFTILQCDKQAEAGIAPAQAAPVPAAPPGYMMVPKGAIPAAPIAAQADETKIW